MNKTSYLIIGAVIVAVAVVIIVSVVHGKNAAMIQKPQDAAMMQDQSMKEGAMTGAMTDTKADGSMMKGDAMTGTK